MVISDTLPGTVPDQQLQDSREGLHPVLGECLQYGLDLTLFMGHYRQSGTDDVPYRTRGTYGHTLTHGGSKDSD